MGLLDDAIEAAGRQVRTQLVVDWPGGANPIFELVTSVTVNQSIGDLPESVTALAATAAAQATITLSASKVTSTGEIVKALALSPFSTSARSTRLVSAYGLKVSVQVIAQILLADGTWASTPVFTGWITGYELEDDGGVTITCRDKSTSAGATPRMPVLAANPLWSTNSTTNAIDPAAAVDLCLRSMGHYITPPMRTDGPLLSIPGVGSPIPELGDITAWTVSAASYPSPWAGLDGPISVGQYLMVQPATPIDWSPGKRVFTEGWIYLPVGYATTESWWNLDNQLAISTVPAAGGGIQWRVSLSAGTTVVDIPTSVMPTTSGWHYIGVQWQIGTGVTVFGDTNAPWTASTGGAISQTTIVRSIQIDRQVLGLQISQPSATPTGNGAWTAAPAMLSFGRRITALPRTSGQSGWQVIQQIAAAYGDVPYFDGAGKFRYLTRDALRAKRFAAAARTLKSDRVLSGAPSWDEDGVRPSVTASSVTPQVKASQLGSPAWQATEVYTIPAQQTYQFDVAVDYQIRDLAPFSSGYETSAARSWVVTTAASAAAAGDPSAESVGIAYVGVTAIDTGLRFTVVNRSTFPVAFWTPVAGSVPAGPYLRVHGTSIVTPEPRDYTAMTGAKMGEPLTLPDSPWRQDPVATAAWVDDVAAELSDPQVQWPNIVIPLDVRLRLGDVILLQDTRYMDVAHPVQIVGIAASLPASGQHTMSLTVRSAYAPTGWVLDVDGRTELDDTTILNV